MKNEHYSVIIDSNDNIVSYYNFINEIKGFQNIDIKDFENIGYKYLISKDVHKDLINWGKNGR